MNSFNIDPLYLTIGIPAAAIGMLLGIFVMWIIGRTRQQRTLDEREAAFELANAKLTETFAELSNRSLQANSDTFLKLAEQNLNTQQEKAKRELSEREKAVESMVKPISDALEASQKQIADLEKSRSEAYGGIKSQLEEMQLNQKSLRQETQNLVNALRRPEVRGRWGEITLRRLVEIAGMVEHCDFAEQVHTETDGQIIRPDMVVRMPDHRELVVDVKTPLDAYLSSIEAKDDVQRQLNLKRHAKNVRAHIRMLASKAYWNQFDESPDFVILFIPGDQFLSAALNEEPDLIEYALSQQIILATPTSFVALLKAVAYGWRQLALADNAKEIRILAEDLYARLATYVSHMNKVGRQLASSVENYNKAVGSLERSVLPGARKFVELGVHPKKEVEKLDSIEAVPRTMIEGNDS
ncbi:MAG: DNA recombination protein RmuC [Woeseiaceae bacterium]|nr:DNA recombination protein RmuC [Woeseiaceae bacterium]